METSSQLKSFQCPIHPNDQIQRVSLSQKAPFPLFCIECILNPQTQSLQLPMLNLASFIDETSQHYRKHKVSRPLSSIIPEDLLSVLKNKQDSIAEFTQYIQSQKTQVIETAAHTLEIIKKCLDQKRDELLHNLDLQLIILKTNFKYYEAKINTFSGNEEVATLQDKDQLVQKINSFEEIEQLVAFLQQIKDDRKEITERDFQINQRMREMSNELMEQVRLPSQHSSTFVKDQDEIFTQIKTNILPILDECFTQVSPLIELLSYVGYGGLELEKLVDILQFDDHAIHGILKHLNKASTDKSALVKIFLEKEASFKKLSETISPTSSSKDQALRILCHMLDEKTMIPIMRKYFDQCLQSIHIGLQSENEQILLTILGSIMAIFREPLKILQDHNRNVHSIFHKNGITRNIFQLRESKYSSVRNLSKQTLSYIGYEGEESYDECDEEEEEEEDEDEDEDEEEEAEFYKEKKTKKLISEDEEEEDYDYEDKDKDEEKDEEEEEDEDEVYECKKPKAMKDSKKTCVKEAKRVAMATVSKKKY